MKCAKHNQQKWFICAVSHFYLSTTLQIYMGDRAAERAREKEREAESSKISNHLSAFLFFLIWSVPSLLMLLLLFVVFLFSISPYAVPSSLLFVYPFNYFRTNENAVLFEFSRFPLKWSVVLLLKPPKMMCSLIIAPFRSLPLRSCLS